MPNRPGANSTLGSAPPRAKKLFPKDPKGGADDAPSRPDRRHILEQAGTGLLGLGVAGSFAAPAQARLQTHTLSIDEPASGNRPYQKVGLASNLVSVGIVQSFLCAVDPKSPRQGLRTNLAHLLEQFHAAQAYFEPKQLLVFHQAALQGWDDWDQADLQRIAMELPGAESQAIGQACRDHGCYAVFGGIFWDDDWPGRVIPKMVLVGPLGDILDAQWKVETPKARASRIEAFLTTVHDVLDPYVERYGQDRVLPVARTPIGNIAMSSVSAVPELYRSLALKGAEIFVRSALGGFDQAEGRFVSRTNRAFTLCNSHALATTLASGKRVSLPDMGDLGRSAIFGPNGNVLASAGQDATLVSARLDVGARRANPSVPEVRMALYAPVMDPYRVGS